MQAQLVCTGQARVLEGNLLLIGRPGGFSGSTVGVIPVTTGSAAVIPVQWVTNQATLRSALHKISGLTTGGQRFLGISDIVGSKEVPNVKRFLMNIFPNTLVIELVSGTDEGVAGITITVPESIGCPQGTRRRP